MRAWDTRSRRGRRHWTLLPLLAALLLSAAGCGGGYAASAGAGEVPTLVFASGRDPLGVVDDMFQGCADASGGRYRVEQLVLPPAVDAQREQVIRRLAARDDSIDIIGMDVIWTAEFSRAGWLYDMTPHVSGMRDQYVPASFATVEYDDRIWAAPHNTNVAMLYYRTDLVEQAPETWQELVQQVAAAREANPDQEGFVWQAHEYEGFVVAMLEFLFGAGVEVLTPDGQASALAASPAATEVMAFARDLFVGGTTPRSVTTFQEEEARQFFQNGRGMFMRNWPYAWELVNSPGSEVAGKVALAPLPAWEGGSRAGVLGGLNWGVSAYSRHQELAAELALCVTSEENQRRVALEKSELPVLDVIYDDPEVQEKMPFIGVARESLNTARVRPVTPYYNDVTVAIADYSHRVITGRADAGSTVQSLDRAISLAVIGEGEI